MTEKIEIGYRNIGQQNGLDYHHKFIIYTNKNGKQQTISGWTGDEEKGLPFGKINILSGIPYDKNNPDSSENLNARNQKQYRELIKEDKDLSSIWAKMVKNAELKNNKYPYDPLLQNSNTLADSVITDAGLPEPIKDGLLNHFSPASGKSLNINLIPENPRQNGILKNIGKLISMEDTQNPNQNIADLHDDKLVDWYEKYKSIFANQNTIDLKSPESMKIYQAALNKAIKLVPELAHLSPIEQLETINQAQQNNNKNTLFIPVSAMLENEVKQNKINSYGFDIEKLKQAQEENAKNIAENQTMSLGRSNA